MSTKIGILDYQIYPQPGFQARRDENGGWTADADFVITTTTWSQASWRARFTKGVSLLTLDPTLDPFFFFLNVTNSTITRNEGGVMTISVECAGSNTGQFGDGDLDDDALPTYRLEGRISEAPFSDHPKWKVLSEVEQIALGKLISGSYEWGPDPFVSPDSETFVTYIRTGEESTNILTPNPITTGDAIDFAKRITKGQSTYFVPTVTYTESTQGTSGMTAAQLSLLGKISTPRGNPPTASGNRDWMLTGASQEQRGDLYQTTIEWTLSGREGYDSFLYS
jgi:hypothetical protein